jgi:hypothetical protein
MITNLKFQKEAIMNQDDKEKIYTEERKTLQPVDSKQKLSYKDLQDIWEEDLISTDMEKVIG